MSDDISARVLSAFLKGKQHEKNNSLYVTDCCALLIFFAFIRSIVVIVLINNHRVVLIILNFYEMFYKKYQKYLATCIVYLSNAIKFINTV